MSKFLREVIQPFLRIESSIRMLVLGDLFLQFGNVALFLLLNYYLMDLGYEDAQIASLHSTRYFGVVLFALPFGMYIRGKRLRPVMQVGALLTPIFGLLLILSLDSSSALIQRACFMSWGISFLLFHVPGMPYILKTAKTENHTASITLYFQTFSLATLTVGVLVFFLRSGDLQLNIKNVLLAFNFISFLGFVFLLRLPKHELNVQKKGSAGQNNLSSIDREDVRRITWAILPTLMIAVGAGLTIPFINMFFAKVHGLGDAFFALFGALSHVLVMVTATFIPTIKKRLGYVTGITGLQSVGVLILIVLGTTQFYADMPWALPIALGAFMVRQPLMNCAGPLTTEVSMYYVGQRNRELVASVQSAIWSGSWFFSSMIFGVLRDRGIDYVFIILATASIYVLGVIGYHKLIRRLEREGRYEDRITQ